MASTLLVSGVSAGNVPVVDPSIELGTPAGPENTGGWSYFNGASQSNLVAHTGNYSIELPNAPGNVPGAFETYNIDVTGGAQFDLTAYGYTNEQIAPPGPSNNNTSFGGIQATFFSGDDGTGSNLGTVATGPGNAAFSNHIDYTSPVGVWIPLDTGVITAPAGSESMQIFALAVFPQLADSNGGIFVDDFTLTNVVPEPASIGLLAIGGVALLARRRRTA
jgi:hypothetical protein